MYPGDGGGPDEPETGLDGRVWGYWTVNKLRILANYLPAFTVASKRAPHKVYIDLLAGRPHNVAVSTLNRFPGSAEIALQTSPPFTHVALCERPAVAAPLDEYLRERFPGRSFRTYSGDCNLLIHQILGDLTDANRSPTFAFVDQQTADVRWETLVALSQFKTAGTKAEIWLLLSPAMLIRNHASLAARRRVDAMLGTADWRWILDARLDNALSPPRFRAEMVNLLRWRLHTQLGYRYTVRIPLHMRRSTEIYDMVFATDHDGGLKIMTQLYRSASEREPAMAREAHAMIAQRSSDKAGAAGLFDAIEAVGETTDAPAWTNAGAWNPEETDWWGRQA